MRKVSMYLTATGLLLALAVSAAAHDPRTTAKDFQSAMIIEGAGKALIEYKAMHFNQGTYDRMKTNEQFRQRMSSTVWNNIGKANLDFDVKFGEETVAKGSYDFGIDIGADDSFSLVFGEGAGARKIQLQTITGDNVSGEYLSVNMTPTTEPDRFMIEARCGKFRSWQTFQVPYLGAHEHPEEKPPAKP